VAINPIKIQLKADGERRLKNHLRNRILALRHGLRDIHETRLVKWRKAYEAVPAEKVREFPFHNASNVVVPIIGIHSDTLLSRIMAAIWKTRPIWYARVSGNHGGEAEKPRVALEEFMNYEAMEPEELDLYRVEREWFGEAIKYGTSTIKVPWETLWESEVSDAGDGSGRVNFSKVMQYDGPRPEKIAFEDFWVPPAIKTLDKADIKIHRRRMQMFELEERRFVQAYDASKVDRILKFPDRTSPIHVQQQLEEDTGARTSSSYGYKEWDIYECWLRYRTQGNIVRIIVTYHFLSDTILRAHYNYYPNTIEPFETARLFYRDDMFYGYGFAEMLGMLQEEISQIHNQRRDNSTVANTKVWRVSPDSKLHKGYRIYPSAMLPAEKDEIEPLQHGEISRVTIEEERLSMDLAERRSGVSSSSQGYGAGVMHGRRGVYTAMGTMALLQEGNNRTDLNISDMRYSHTRLGRIITKEFAAFGLGGRPLLFGEMSEDILAAFEAVKNGTIGLPIYSSTASINREVEKQNDIMLTSVLNRHYGTITEMLSQMNNPQLPEEAREYVKKAVTAADNLMREVMRHFGYNEVDRFVPEVPSGQAGNSPKELQGGPRLVEAPGGQTF